MSKIITITKAIVKNTAKIEELQAALVAAEAKKVELAADLVKAEAEDKEGSKLRNGLPSGTVIVFSFGKAGNKKNIEATVVGFKPAEGKSPALYKATAGEGFDTRTYTVPVYEIVAVVEAEQE